MTTDTTTVAFSVGDRTFEYGFETTDAVDETALKITATYRLTVDLLDLLAEDPAAAAALGWTQRLVDQLETALEVGKRVVRSETYAAFVEDVTALPDDLLDDVAATLVPVAATFQVAIDLPERDAPTTLGLEDVVTAAPARRGS